MSGAEPQQLVLASHNAHKLEELRRIIGPALQESHSGRAIELIGYDGPEPTENGTTFEENALLKARAAAEHTGLPAIADDSGISVEILGGSPGIFSARWGGPARDDTANLELLLWQLTDVPDEHRAAAFVCAAALVVPGSGEATPPSEIALRGEWPGSILRERRGAGGFGYDPIFQPAGEHRSAAELAPEEKDEHSHRTRAFSALVPEIHRLLGSA